MIEGPMQYDAAVDPSVVAKTARIDGCGASHYVDLSRFEYRE
jgi:hypothetical protein